MQVERFILLALGLYAGKRIVDKVIDCCYNPCPPFPPPPPPPPYSPYPPFPPPPKPPEPPCYYERYKR